MLSNTVFCLPPDNIRQDVKCDFEMACHGLYKCDMEEEKKEVVETTPEDSKSEEDASKQTTPEEQPKEQPAEEVPNYEALYQEEKERREKAEHKIVKLRANNLEEEKEEEPKEDIKSYVDQRLNEIQIQTQEERYNEEINKISSNESEKKLIRLHLETNNLSGSIAEKVQKAKALANYKRIAEVNKELSKTLETKPSGEDSSSYKSQPPKSVSGLTVADIAHLKKRGLYEKYLEKYGK